MSEYYYQQKTIIGNLLKGTKEGCFSSNLPPKNLNKTTKKSNTNFFNGSPN